MADRQDSIKCPTCDEIKLVAKPKPNIILHVIMGAITFGLWIPVAFIAGIMCRVAPWRCQTCGTAISNKDAKAIYKANLTNAGAVL